MTKQAPKPFICSSSLESMKEAAVKAGEAAFRAAQVLDWVYKKFVFLPDEMKNIPSSFRLFLKENFFCPSSETVQVSESDDGTKKLLIKLFDGETIEAVIIPSPDRVTFCLSTQVGCPVSCLFCASGKNGLKRNMKSGEIIEQLYHCVKESGAKPDNIVFMGIGEGFLNYDELNGALEIMSSPDGFGIAQRRITVSTSGWTQGIKKLADSGKQWNLAVSLHAPDDATRSRIIPDKFRRPVQEIIKACVDYFEKTGRIVTFEYTLLAGVNDSRDHALKLASLAREANAKINIIPYNEVEESGFKRPNHAAIRNFTEALKQKNAKFTVRSEKGSSKNAACGQLRQAGH